MSRHYSYKLAIGLFCVLLAACGGGGGGDKATVQNEANSGTDSGSAGTDGNGSTDSGDGGSIPPTGNTDGSTPPSGGTDGNAGSPTEPSSPAVFAATLVTAPPDGAFLGSSPYEIPVPFVVEGSGLENVELVSAADASIKYGTFTVSSDKTRATLDWNPYNWMYGSYDLRVLAWDAPAGQSGREIETMAARHYIIKLPLGCYPQCGGAAP